VRIAIRKRRCDAKVILRIPGGTPFLTTTAPLGSSLPDSCYCAPDSAMFGASPYASKTIGPVHAGPSFAPYLDKCASMTQEYLSVCYYCYITPPNLTN